MWYSGQAVDLPGLVDRVEFPGQEGHPLAKTEDVDTDITLELGGSEITPDKFRKSVNAFVGLLEAITKSVCREAPLVEWRIQVKAGSNLVGANAAEGANPQHVRHILALTGQGLEQFEIEGEVPPVYPDEAIKRIRELSNLTAKSAEDDTRIGLWVKKRRTEITPAIHTAVRAALRPGFSEYGTIEGQLSVLSDRKGVHFVIYERVWDRPVRCTVTDDLLERMMDYWRKRIAAHGMVHYRPDGLPVRIEADDIDVFPDDNELPSHDDVLGALRERA